MCSFKSMIVTKSGDILHINGEDSHENIIQRFCGEYDLRDIESEPKKLLFARIEITPPNRNVFEKDLKKWTFNIDQAIRPTWFKKPLQNKCFEELEKILSEIIIDGQTIKLIENKNGLYIRNSKIGVIKNSRVGELRENSEVGELRGNSQVGVLRENSRVGVLWGNSRVGVLRENSQVGELRENSQVGVLRENSRVGVLWGNSQVGELMENSEVGELRENSQVGVLRENSRVGVLWGNSQVGELRENSQVGELRENSQVGELWGKSQVGELRENSQVGELWGKSQIKVFSSNAKYKLNDNSLAIIRYKPNIEIECANKNIKLININEDK